MPVDYPHAEAIPAALHGPTQSLHGLTIVVTGLGVSGFPMAVHLAERHAEVIVVDGDAERDLSEWETILGVFDVDIRRGPEHVTDLPLSASGKTPDLVVTSPGWRPDHPIFTAAHTRGIPVIGEVELAWRVRGHNTAPWLVVTGTNGKTTTTSMLEAMLTAAGLKAKACGNIGQPLIEAVLDPAAEVLAVELSSFQLHWQYSMSAHAAAVLNLAPDHVDWHGGYDAYQAAKARAYANVVAACVYNVDDPATRTLVEEAEVIEGARAIGFTTGMPAPGSFGVVDGVLVDRAYLHNRQSTAAELGTLEDVAIAAGSPGAPAAPHQIANALAAAALARSIDIPPAAVRDGLRAHRPADHRMAVVAASGGVRWINDSKATNPHAADAALRSAERIVWIAGGLTKGADLHELIAAHAHRLAAVVLIGTDPEPYTTALAAHAPDVPIIRIDPAAEVSGTSGAEAASGGAATSRPASTSGPADESQQGAAIMAAAVQEAAALAQDGDTVLLAPAAASMDQFLNYGTRGSLFAQAVQGLVS